MIGDSLDDRRRGVSLTDVSACAEARAWAHSPGALGLAMCACGFAGSLRATRASSGQHVYRTYRHNFHIDPLILFDPDAVTVAAGIPLGPGLHRAIERRHFVEHECMDGTLVGGYEEMSTVE